jgi:hypothetical protein
MKRHLFVACRAVPAADIAAAKALDASVAATDAKHGVTP